MNTTNYFATIQKSRIKKFALTHNHGFQKKIFQIFTNVKILVKLQDQIVPLVKIPNISSVRSSVRKIYSSWSPLWWSSSMSRSRGWRFENLKFLDHSWWPFVFWNQHCSSFITFMYLYLIYFVIWNNFSPSGSSLDHRIPEKPDRRTLKRIWIIRRCR